MKAILLVFDTLRKQELSPYGNQCVITPNFQRLAEHCVTFDNAYIGSMPCMPARRELHTGRYNFLHRSWGPLEPFDDSMPELLKKSGVYTHLVTDHMHYWEDGGATYHTRYSTFSFVRGQEGDPWKGEAKDPEIPRHYGARDGMPLWRQDWINRKYMSREENMSMPRVFAEAEEFLRANCENDNWFLQIENFSPHEPFHAPQKYLDMYGDNYEGPHFNWPDYATVKEDEDAVEHCKKCYAAAVTMCDAYLGKFLDLMDELKIWDDTLLIVNTDHGFLLGEHDRWGKRVCSNYNEIANIPLFIWEPVSRKQGERNENLVQTIDLPATLLSYFQLEIPSDMQGVPLQDTIRYNRPVREYGLFGLFGAEVNCTDGRYVYMRAPVDEEKRAYNYTLMPMYMSSRFLPKELKAAEIAPPFSFTKDCFTLKVEAPPFLEKPFLEYERQTTRLYDLQSDPEQRQPVENAAQEERMKKKMVELMKQSDAPSEQFERLGL